MAQAALKHETEPQETLLIPDGGIASFLTATEGAWADDKDIPQNGIAQVTHIADRLAEYGRHEDEYMVHAAEGETVIPMAVLEANPHLRKNLFAQMEIMGLDPERYVVGNELNSINPVTGQPEFFLKKLFKGVKKLVKKVVKVVKKALPYVLPIALSFTPLGPVFGAALGSGIGTLMQGGDLGDALKAAVISGGIGGLSAGISGMISGQGFGAGVKGAFGNVGERFGQALGGARPEGAGYWGSPFRPVEAPAPTIPALEGIGSQVGSGTVADVARNIVGGPPRPLALEGIGSQVGGGTVADVARNIVGGPPRPLALEGIGSQVGGGTVADVARNIVGGPPRPLYPTPATGGAYSIDDIGNIYDASGRLVPDFSNLGVPAPGIEPYPLSAPTARPTVAPTQVADQLPFGDQSLRPFDATSSIYDPADTLTADRGWWGTAKDVFTGGGKSPSHWEKLMKDAGEAYIANTPEKFQTAAGFEAAKAAAGPGMLARYGPSLAAAGVGAGAAGFFDPPEPEEDEDEDDPFKDHDPLAYQQYQIAFPTTPTYTMEDIRVPGREVGFAQGGVASLEEARAFPRRSGGIAGPGTGRSDDVPAMLSDGEFVMTAEAVKGAGKGSRNNGMKNMYQLMRTFEASV